MDEAEKIRLAVIEKMQDEHKKNNDERFNRVEKELSDIKTLIINALKTINDKLETLTIHKTQIDTKASSIWKTLTIIGITIVSSFTIGKVLFDIFKH